MYSRGIFFVAVVLLRTTILTVTNWWKSRFEGNASQTKQLVIITWVLNYFAFQVFVPFLMGSNFCKHYCKH